MSALYSTSFHRFNTVGSSGGSTSNAAAMVGTAIGTASLPGVSDDFTLTDPTVIDDSGNTQTFSQEITNAGHAGYTIKGIQIQTQTSSSLTAPGPVFDYRIKLTGGSNQTIVSFGPLSYFPYDVKQFPTNGTFNTFNLNLNTTNVDDLELTAMYNSTPDQCDWEIYSNSFNTGTPTPAMRIWYELIPKITITTGKLSITSGKVSIE
mgnify:CR=1 FL=1|tara:strand:- start:1509 stop:2126 length:618 start_codon:yes stop_codon:yes gene_type:complete